MNLFQKGEYEPAIPVGKKAIALARSEFGETDTLYAIANHNLAEAYYALEQWDEAKPLYKIAIRTYALNKQISASSIALCNNSLGNIFLSQNKFDSAQPCYEAAFLNYFRKPQENYQGLIAVTTNLHYVYYYIGKNKEDQVLYEKMLPLIEQQEGKQTSSYYLGLRNLAIAYKLQQLLTEAEKAMNFVLTIFTGLKGSNNLEYANLLDELGGIILEQGRPKEAEQVVLKAYDLKTNLPGVDTISLVSNYNALGNIYTELADYPKALDFFQQAIALLEKANAQTSDWYEVTLRNYGLHYIQRGMPAEAKSILMQLLDVQTAKYGNDYPDNGTILTLIANTEFGLNEFALAEQHAKEGMQIIIHAYGKENNDVAKAMQTLGQIYHKLGKSTEGIELYQQAITIIKKIFGNESDHFANSLSELGLIHQELNNFAQAEILLKESLNIRKKIYGQEHPLYALSLANLSLVYAAQGRYANADPLLAEAIQIYIKKGLANTNNFLILLNNVASMSDQMGRYEESAKIYGQLLQFLRADKNKNDATLFIVLNNLSINSLRQKKYGDALHYALEATEIAKNYFGSNTQNYITAKNNSFAAYLEKGDLLKAEDLVAEIIPVGKKVMGEKAPLLATVYFNAAVLQTRMNNLAMASQYLDSFSRITLYNLHQNFYTLSEKEKLTWWQEQSSRFNLAPSLLMLQPSSSELLKENFANQQLQLKGFVLNDAAMALRRARQSGNNKLKTLIDEWQLNRGLVSKQTSIPVNERTFSLDSLENIANELEKQINQLSAGLFQQKMETVDWKTIQASLAEDEAAIEFIRFHFFNKDWTDTMQYAALIIRKNSIPQFVPLCTEAQISYCLNGAKNNDRETNINRLYRSTITGNKNNGNFLGDSLYKLIWQPLLPYLQNIHVVSYAPDGLLHKVAFHALPTPDKKILIDQYRLQQFTSIRQLANRSGEKTNQWTSVFLLGNANFNSLPGASNGSATTAAARTGNSAWNALPGTGKEILSLQPLFAKARKIVTMVNGVDASEESIKKLDGHSPSIMHLATHGFFLPDPTTDSVTKSTSKNLYALSNDPLVRSGIVVSGANNAWNGTEPPTGIENGIVTAYEIAQLDLHQTQLVVLSACETALGDLQGTEGVFGLQRALKIAGVKNIIVSLWQVPDKETVELMTAFYTNLLSGKEVREAFYLAQKEMRSKYAPFFWAAFVLVE
jgi:CHAT domain-containing protein/tetratricopeptide (TPR) repeat protein